MPRSCYIQLSAIDGSHSLLPSPSLLSSMRRIVAGIYDPLPTPTTVGSRGVTKVAFQNLFREISGLRKRGEKKKEREKERKKKERRREKKSRALAFDRALDRNAERSSLRAGSERPSPNCRQRDTMPPFSVFLSFDRFFPSAKGHGKWRMDVLDVLSGGRDARRSKRYVKY